MQVLIVQYDRTRAQLAALNSRAYLSAADLKRAELTARQTPTVEAGYFDVLLVTDYQARAAALDCPIPTGIYASARDQVIAVR